MDVFHEGGDADTSHVRLWGETTLFWNAGEQARGFVARRKVGRLKSGLLEELMRLARQWQECVSEETGADVYVSAANGEAIEQPPTSYVTKEGDYVRETASISI